jgi:hypothetical protein
MKRTSRWVALCAALAIVVVCAAIVRAQQRVIIEQPYPLRVTTLSGQPFQRGGLYQVYFATPIVMPGLGLRQRVFLMVMETSSDGWLRVQYADEISDQGAERATLMNPAVLTLQQVPVLPVELTLRLSEIAALSTRLNADTTAARYWPIY